jgi:hypothetical protein
VVSTKGKRFLTRSGTLPLSQRVFCTGLPAAMVIFLTSFLESATPQEAVKLSVTGETAAHARIQRALESQQSGAQAGPFSIRMSTGFNIEANDNILLEPRQTEGDLILRPYLGGQVSWQPTERNVLRLAVDAGYSWYLRCSQLDRFFIQPGSELAFDLYVGEVWLNFHDRFSISQNVYEDPTVTGIGNYSQLQNAAGLSAIWDFRSLEITLGYDHTDYLGLFADTDLPSGRSEVFALNTSVDPGLPVRLGSQFGAGITHYVSKPASQETVNLSAGAFVRGQPMRYVTLEASAGCTAYSDRSPLGGKTGTFQTFYGQLAINHRVNRYFDYDVRGGHSVSFGFYAGTIDLYEFIFETRTHCFQKIAVTTGFVFEHGSELFAARESFDRFGPHLKLERPIGRNLSAALRYQYFKRRADTLGGDYDINILELSLLYRM